MYGIVPVECDRCGDSADVAIAWEYDPDAGIMGVWACVDVIRGCACDEGDPYCTRSIELGEAFAEQFDGDF